MKDVSRSGGPKYGRLLFGQVLLGVLLELVVLEVLNEEGGWGHMIDWDLVGQLLLMLLMLKYQVGLQLLMRHQRDGWRLVLKDFLLWGLGRVWLRDFLLRGQYWGQWGEQKLRKEVETFEICLDSCVIWLNLYFQLELHFVLPDLWVFIYGLILRRIWILCIWNRRYHR